ncbi:MAG TPA: ThuA domain-containing protein, partial [Flavisolibacter sp.]|nr:ThuA domain-containing protein [Flavisolibacter sp.]
MKFSAITVPVFLCVVLLAAGSFREKLQTKPRLLVFSRTEAFHHTSIPAGNAALLKLGKEHGFEVDTTTDNTVFREENLKQYAAVVFLSTTGNVLNSEQENAFERYIQAGGGFVGIHAATDTEYDWGWYGRLVGAYFESHPKTQDATLRVLNTNHPATAPLQAEWRRNDEWYNFKKLSKDITPLITIDEKSYEGGRLGDNHPMAWYHEYDGGRAFYTALGHTEESYAEPLFLAHLLGGIRYAIGEGKALNYSKARTAPIPEEDRFVKTMLTQGTLFEPTEMAILPNLDILLIQRRGEVMLLNGKTNAVKQVGFLKAYNQTKKAGVNAEEGVLGLAIDPDFTKNNYVYIFYSPIDTSVNRLSRFVFKNNKLEAASEKVILQFYSQREICCHTGGSIAFGKDNLLYLSTGDNSTPFNEAKQAFVNNGYAPLNDAPGHEQYDARRSSGNSND